ncbi:MAG TPA: hypothetical protein VFK02_32475 [Kofleriaceae bacterium]|nr:hypothetical protein [Kofleriaceae bacterium]
MRSIALPALVPTLFAIVATLALPACGDSKSDTAACTYRGTSYAVGDVFPQGDGCNSCTCTASGVSCTARACTDAGVDANPASCAASAGCPEGPACGTLCCKSGERCVNGTCRCGSMPGCGTLDSCEGVGPVGSDGCGAICCGGSGPCPQ